MRIKNLASRYYTLDISYQKVFFFSLTFLAATCESRCLVAITIARAVSAFWSATAVVLLALGIHQWRIAVARLDFHACANVNV